MSVLIWVEASRDDRYARAMARDGATYQPNWERWAASERALFARDRTRERADLVIDTSAPVMDTERVSRRVGDGRVRGPVMGMMTPWLRHARSPAETLPAETLPDESLEPWRGRAAGLGPRAARRSRRIGLGGLDRLRQRSFLIVQCALAGALAWWIAKDLLGHPQPFFAPVAAIVALGLSFGQRLRRVTEVVIGVAIGVFIGDVFVQLFGRGSGRSPSWRWRR